MNALTAIKALIMKSRPAYKDYLGKATKIVKIYEGTLPEDGSQIEANCLDPNFEGFVTGEYYDVVIDGEQKKCLGFLSDDKCCIGCADSLEELQQLLSEENPNVWYAVILINGTITLAAIGSFANKSITISKTVSEEKYDIKKLPEECLPDSVGKKINTVSTAITKLQSLVNDTESMANEALSTAQDAQHNISTTNNIANTAKSTAEAAQSTAETAKTTAETAKTTAEAAQSTAETAKTTAEAAQTTANSIMPDWNENDESSRCYIANRSHYTMGQTVITNTRKQNGSSMCNDIAYLMSQTHYDPAEYDGAILKCAGDTFVIGKDVKITKFSVNAFYIKSPYNSDKVLLFVDGSGTFGSFRPGGVSGSVQSFSFTTDGVYATYKVTSITFPEQVKKLDDKYVPDTIQRVGDDVIINSSAVDSTKKFKITVDDSGTPTVTNTDDSTISWTPTKELPTVTTSDSGKFLRVSSTGEWAAETISNAEEVSF